MQSDWMKRGMLPERDFRGQSGAVMNERRVRGASGSRDGRSYRAIRFRISTTIASKSGSP